MIRNLFSLVVFSVFVAEVSASQINTDSDHSPITFIENKGQWPSDIRYQAVSTGINVYFLNDGLSFAHAVEEEDSTGHDIYISNVWNLKYMNVQGIPQIIGKLPVQSKISYLKGNDSSQWVIHPPEFSVLKYKDLYPNIDLDYYGKSNNLKYDYIVHPGGDVSAIRNYYEGSHNLSITAEGELEITTSTGKHFHKAPYSYQNINGHTIPVEVSYVLLNDSTFGFNVTGSYNQQHELVIDPLFQLVWSTYAKAAGASNNINYGFANAMDAAGNVYITGMVDGYYPTTAGAYSGPGTVVPEIFVSKFSKNGSSLIYSTYISGSSSEMGTGIAVDALGQAYITGLAMSNWTGSNTYPTTAGAFQPAIYPFGGNDAVLSVLNATGTGLVYSTFLGGDNDDQGYAIALGSPGIVYITGNTKSNGTTFPTKGASSASQQLPQGYGDAFVAKFDITKTGINTLIYSIRIGGGGEEQGRSIAVNSAGNAFITGITHDYGNPPAFPVTAGAYSTTYNGGWDNSMAYVTKLSATTPVIYVYSTYIGPGAGHAIALNEASEAFVTGGTSTFTFPVTPNVLQHLHGRDALQNPNSDAFITKLNANGSALIYSTFLGGERSESGTGIAVNSANEAYISGMTMTGFPASPNSIQPNHATGGGDSDFFVAHINTSGSGYGCGGSTYFGGNSSDYNSSMYDFASPRISLRDHGGVNDTISVSGTTHSTNFPTTGGSYSPNKLNGIADQPVFFKMTCFQTLPVELMTFSGLQSDQQIILNWTTATEINNDFFIVERSADGIDFRPMDKIQGYGNSVTPRSYRYIDGNPLKGINYYRLRQVDFDGTVDFSDMIAIDFLRSKSECFTLMSNTNDVVRVYCTELFFGYAQIFSMDGRLMKKAYVKEFTEIDLNDLSNGMYIIRISNMDMTHTARIVVQ